MEFAEHYFLVPIFSLLVCVWGELENTKKKDDKNASFVLCYYDKFNGL